MEEIVERGWSEVLKIIRDLIQPELCYIELDGRKVGTIYAFEGWHDRIREALEGREATPEEIATMVKRLANAELLIEKLKGDVGHWEEDFTMFDRAHEKVIDLWRKEHPDAGYTPDMSDLNEWMVRRVEKAEAVKESLTNALREIEEISADRNLYDFKQICDIANAALRTAEESSVVGLIDGTHAKQQEDSANTGGDGGGEVMTKLEKLMTNPDRVREVMEVREVKRIIIKNSCPSEFGLEDCEFNPETGCTLCCTDCWNQEVES